MFERKDYSAYFDQLARVEKEMEKRGRRILAALPDEKSRKLMRSLVRDEQRHGRVVEKIKQLFFGKKWKSLQPKKRRSSRK